MKLLNDTGEVQCRQAHVRENGAQYHWGIFSNFNPASKGISNVGMIRHV